MCIPEAGQSAAQALLASYDQFVKRKITAQADGKPLRCRQMLQHQAAEGVAIHAHAVPPPQRPTFSI